MKKNLDELNKVKKKSHAAAEKETGDKDKYTGKWIRSSKMTWRFQQGQLSGDAEVENIMGEAQRILEEKKTTLQSKVGLFATFVSCTPHQTSLSLMYLQRDVTAPQKEMAPDDWKTPNCGAD